MVEWEGGGGGGGRAFDWRRLKIWHFDVIINLDRRDQRDRLSTLLGFKFDKHLKWETSIDHLISKVNSTILLLKRAKDYLTVHCGKLV